MRVHTTLDSMAKLQQQLRDAGLIFERIGIDGTPEDGELIIWNDGEPDLEIMKDPKVKAVVDSHIPDPPIQKPDFGADEPPSDIRAQAVQTVQQLRGYIALASPTNAQTVGIVKVMARTMLYIVRHVLLPPDLPDLPPLTLPPIFEPEQLPGAEIAAEIAAEQDADRIAAIERDAALMQEYTAARMDALSLVVTIRQAAELRGLTDVDLATSIIQTAESLRIAPVASERDERPAKTET